MGADTGDNSQFPDVTNKTKTATWADTKVRKFTLVTLTAQVDVGEKPFQTIHDGLKAVTEAASSVKKEVVKLGTLKKRAPFISPKQFSILWPRFDAYVHIEGDRKRVARVPKKKPIKFEVTICLAAYSYFDENNLDSITSSLVFADQY